MYYVSLSIFTCLRRMFIMATLTIISNTLTGQTYSPADSVSIYQLLGNADEEAVTGSLQKAMEFTERALQLSRQKQMKRGEGFAKLKKADILLQQSDFEKIPALLQDGVQVAEIMKDTFMLALAHYQQGQYHLFKEQLTEAEKYFELALELYFEKQQSSYTSSIYNDLGYLQGGLNNLDQEAYWYLKALRVQEKVEDLSGMAITTNNLANVYANIGDSVRAFDFARESIAMRQQLGDIQGLSISYENLSRMFWNRSLDSASKYQQLAMRYAERSGLALLIMRSYDNLSVLMDKRRDKKEALEWIQKSIALSRQGDDKAGLASRLRWAAILSADLGDTSKMEELYQESYLLSSAMQNKRMLRDYFSSRANTYRKLRNYEKAYANLEKFYSYKDSLLHEETASNIARLQLQFDTEKKDNEIAKLNTEQRIRQLEIEKQKAIISGNDLEAQKKEGEIRYLSQQQELRDARILQQAEELEKQLLIAQNNQQELQLADQERQLKDRQIKNQQLVRNLILAGIVLLVALALVLFNRFQLKRRIAQQNELLAVRNHIARDLHDEIGSTLTSIKILSQVSRNNLVKDHEKAAQLLEKITEQSSHMQQGMSDIVWAINPGNDKLENMLIRMREYAAHTLESKNIDTIFKVNELAVHQSLNMQSRKDLFLIYKEALNNTAKYSQATRVQVNMDVDDGKLLMRITDDGIGFTENRATSSNGLKNMKARAEAIGGKLDIRSAPGIGTEITAIIPTT